jgi:hypothetical protein
MQQGMPHRSAGTTPAAPNIETDVESPSRVGPRPSLPRRKRGALGFVPGSAQKISQRGRIISTGDMNLILCYEFNPPPQIRRRRCDHMIPVHGTKTAAPCTRPPRKSASASLARVSG